MLDVGPIRPRGTCGRDGVRSWDTVSSRHRSGGNCVSRSGIAGHGKAAPRVQEPHRRCLRDPEPRVPKPCYVLLRALTRGGCNHLRIEPRCVGGNHGPGVHRYGHFHLARMGGRCSGGFEVAGRLPPSDEMGGEGQQGAAKRSAGCGESLARSAVVSNSTMTACGHQDWNPPASARTPMRRPGLLAQPEVPSASPRHYPPR